MIGGSTFCLRPTFLETCWGHTLIYITARIYYITVYQIWNVRDSAISRPLYSVVTPLVRITTEFYDILECTSACDSYNDQVLDRDG